MEIGSCLRVPTFLVSDISRTVHLRLLSWDPASAHSAGIGMLPSRFDRFTYMQQRTAAGLAVALRHLGMQTILWLLEHS
jgi:hypothetical protein